MKKVLFIINPISGIGKQKIVEQLIGKHLDKTMFEVEIQYTNAPGHATELSSIASDKFDIVVAVGGDGSVNEVAKGLVSSNAAMAIIPAGSGNGFARALKIPLNHVKAIELINEHQVKDVDTILMNEDFFVNVAGIGFDAHIAHLFATYGKRGFVSYIKLILKEFKKYNGVHYTLQIGDQKYQRNAFLTSFANSTQYGNDGHIAPLASPDDGLIDICIVHKFPLIKVPVFIIRLFNKSVQKFKEMEIHKAAEFSLHCRESIIAHIDGEPVSYGSDLHLKINPLSIKVCIPM